MDNDLNLNIPENILSYAKYFNKNVIKTIHTSKFFKRYGRPDQIFVDYENNIFSSSWMPKSSVLVGLIDDYQDIDRAKHDMKSIGFPSSFEEAYRPGGGFYLPSSDTLYLYVAYSSRRTNIERRLPIFAIIRDAQNRKLDKSIEGIDFFHKILSTSNKIHTFNIYNQKEWCLEESYIE